MATPPSQRDANMLRNGARLMGLGAVMVIIGLAIAIPLSGTAAGIGWAIVAVGCIPGAAGLGLFLSAVVSRRSRAGKPFA